MNSKKKGMSLLGKQRAAGWMFLAPATIMIADYELLSNDTCIYHFSADRRRAKYAICRSDLQQL